MSGPSAGVVPGVEAETAVPTLKVMRLQKPELHSASTRTLETRSLLGSAMCLPDSFGVIHVGETFTAYLGALNVSKTLPVTRLTVTAQLQTPSQRWHLASSLDAGNQAGGVDVKPETGIDAIVAHALEEPGQHILRVEVGYGAGDGTIKTLRKFYRFQVTSPLNIRQECFRTGDSCCFVTVSVQNNGAETKSGLTICSAEFEPASGLVAEPIGSSSKKNKNSTLGVDLYDGSGRLEPDATRRYLFKISATTTESALRGIAAGDDLGKAVFSWRKAAGEMGSLSAPSIVCPPSNPMLDPTDPSATMTGMGSSYVSFLQGSGLSVDVATASAQRLANPQKNPNSLDKLLPVTVEPVNPPNQMALAQPKEVQFMVVNHSSEAMTLQLQFRLEYMTGLTICGSSYKNIEQLPASGGSTTVSMNFIALEPGLTRLMGCCVLDLASGTEIPQPPLFNVMVNKPQQ